MSPIVHLLALLSLFPGILTVQFGLDHAFGVLQADSDSKIGGLSLATLGLAWLLVAVILVEFNPYPAKQASVKDRPEPSAPLLPLKYRAWEQVFPPGGQTVIEVFLLQWIIILLYASMLDGGIRFRGCLYSYIAYLIGVIVPFVRRGFALMKGDLFYVKWAWLPMITVGVPLFVSVSKGKWPIG
jgi:hypothetical protein